MKYRYATQGDLNVLAEWNEQLIIDEGHRNVMTQQQLRERMAGWLEQAYQAVMFEQEGIPVAYALYREDNTDIYLRQFFVCREYRRQGIGHDAFELLRRQIWPSDKRITVDVLTTNTAAVAFWRKLGYRDYALTLEILP